MSGSGDQATVLGLSLGLSLVHFSLVYFSLVQGSGISVNGSGDEATVLGVRNITHRQQRYVTARGSRCTPVHNGKRQLQR